MLLSQSSCNYKGPVDLKLIERICMYLSQPVSSIISSLIGLNWIPGLVSAQSDLFASYLHIKPNSRQFALHLHIKFHNAACVEMWNDQISAMIQKITCYHILFKGSRSIYSLIRCWKFSYFHWKLPNLATLHNAAYWMSWHCRF